MLASGEVRAEGEDLRVSFRMELEHFDWVAEIEVEELVGGELVHLRECAGFEEIVDCGAGGTGAAGQGKIVRGSVGAAEEASLDGMGFQFEAGFDLGGGHEGEFSRAEPVECGYEGAGLYDGLVQGLPGGKAVPGYAWGRVHGD